MNCKVDPIPVNSPLLNGNEKKYLMQCIDTGWISSEGSFVTRFEEQLSARVGRHHGIAVSSGSGALEIALAALDIGHGDEVILPAFTIISCASAIVRAGADPVLVDSDPQTWNMDVSGIESRITSRTKAIMAVHIYGLPVDMDEILRLAEKYGLYVIEDAAEMLGQTYKGRPCGSFGDISTFSFYANKHLTTGEGGMLVTDDPQIAEKCRSLRNLCLQPGRRFVHEELGWNMRMTNLQGAVGVAQLECVDDFVVKKRNMGRLYSELLKDIPGIRLPLGQTGDAENIYWVYGLVLENGTKDVATAIKELAEQDIGSRPFFWCMHEQPVFQKMGLFTDEHYPVAENLARRGFYIPSGLAITDDQIHRVSDALHNILQ